MKKILLLLLVVIIVLSFGYGYLQSDGGVGEKTIEPIIEEAPKEEVIVEEVKVEEAPVEKVKDICETNSDCVPGKFCIDGECGVIADLYVTEGCTTKCNFNSIVIETSDGDEFTLNRGQGDYTAAGAIEWTLASGPDYCQGEEIIVPVKIKKKNYGKVISEEYLTVGVNELSPVIKHPAIKRISFTFKVKKVNEECSQHEQ